MPAKIRVTVREGYVFRINDKICVNPEEGEFDVTPEQYELQKWKLDKVDTTEKSVEEPEEVIEEEELEESSENAEKSEASDEKEEDEVVEKEAPVEKNRSMEGDKKKKTRTKRK